MQNWLAGVSSKDSASKSQDILDVEEGGISLIFSEQVGWVAYFGAPQVLQALDGNVTVQGLCDELCTRLSAITIMPSKGAQGLRVALHNTKGTFYSGGTGREGRGGIHQRVPAARPFRR